MPPLLLVVLLLSAVPSARAAEPFPEAMVSLTFDDGYASQYELAAPALSAHGLRATFFLFRDGLEPGFAGSMTVAQAQALAANGHEIGSHSLTHPDLVALTDARLALEAAESARWLEARLGIEPVRSFAFPYGSFDARVLAAVAPVYAASRTVLPGPNYRDSDRSQLHSTGCNADTPVDALKRGVDEAVAARTWLILHLHQITEGAPATPYGFSIENLRAILDHLVQRGVRVVTIREGQALMDGAAPLRIDGPTAQVPPRGAVALAAAGGAGGYRWSLLSAPSGGAIDAAGRYAAGPVGDVTDVVEVADSVGGRATLAVVVGAPLAIVGAPGAPPRLAVHVGDSVAWAASGGSGRGHLWSLATDRSGAAIHAQSGRYIAGRLAGVTDVVRVTDDLGNVATAEIAVTQAPAVGPEGPQPSQPLRSDAPAERGGCGHGAAGSLSLLLALGALARGGASRGAVPREP